MFILVEFKAGKATWSSRVESTKIFLMTVILTVIYLCQVSGV